MAEKRTYTKKETTQNPIPANEYGKLPPQALELEEDVLGAVMLEKDAYFGFAQTVVLLQNIAPKNI